MLLPLQPLTKHVLLLCSNTHADVVHFLNSKLSNQATKVRGLRRGVDALTNTAQEVGNGLSGDGTNSTPRQQYNKHVAVLEVVRACCKASSSSNKYQCRLQHCIPRQRCTGRNRVHGPVSVLPATYIRTPGLYTRFAANFDVNTNFCWLLLVPTPPCCGFCGDHTALITQPLVVTTHAERYYRPRAPTTVATYL